MAQFSQTIIQQVPIAVVVYEANGEVVLANNKARQLLGVSGLRQLNSLSKISHELADFIVNARSGGRKVIQVKVGSETLHLMVSVTRFATGKSVQKIVSLQNIRTELDRQEVQAWQDLARVLSHEIMNSITPITSLSHSACGMLRSVADGEVQPDFELLEDVASAVETIARRSDGLLEFVERYREVARLPEPSLDSVNLGVLLEQVVHLMRSDFSEHNIQLELIFDDLPDIQIDEQMINQALINLLLNAKDAVVGIDKAYIEIKATRGSLDEVKISVKDNGRGIAESDSMKVWIPFFTTKNKGSGVGLSLVRQIVIAHGGTVSINSNEGIGTAVIISLVCGS